MTIESHRHGNLPGQTGGPCHGAHRARIVTWPRFPSTGVAVEVGSPITFAWHRDGEREILLLFYRARMDCGRHVGLQGHEVRWVTPAELVGLPTPPTDAALVSLLARGRVALEE